VTPCVRTRLANGTGSPVMASRPGSKGWATSVPRAGRAGVRLRTARCSTRSRRFSSSRVRRVSLPRSTEARPGAVDVNNTVRPSGRNVGRISKGVCGPPSGSGSASVGSPPTSGIRCSLNEPSGPASLEKTIVPSRFQVPPPKMPPTRASVVGTPPATATFFSSPLAKNAIDWLSGLQKSDVAPSVPASGRAAGSSSARMRIVLGPSGRRATMASVRASGERTTEVATPWVRESASSQPSGMATDSRSAGAGAGRDATESSTARTIAAAPATAAMALAMRSRCGGAGLRGDRRGWRVERALERQPHVADVGGALPQILAQADLQHADDAGWKIGWQPGVVRIPLQHLRQRQRDLLVPERAVPRQHLVEDCAERPDVRAPVRGLSARLLGTHVRGRTQDHSRLGHRRSGDGRRHRRAASRGARPLRIERLGQTEVENLDRAVGADLDVGGLQIPVDDPVLVRGLERLGDLPRRRQRLVHRQGTLAETVGERGPFDQLHDERGYGVSGISGTVLQPVDRGDVGMVERRQHFGFALEPRQPLGVRRDGRGQHLDGDLALQPRVGRAIHLAHAACPERAEHLVDADALSGRQRHRACTRPVDGPPPSVSRSRYGPSVCPATAFSRGPSRVPRWHSHGDTSLWGGL
jgi:hypothetical protein